MIDFGILVGKDIPKSLQAVAKPAASSDALFAGDDIATKVAEIRSRLAVKSAAAKGAGAVAFGKVHEGPASSVTSSPTVKAAASPKVETGRANGQSL